jgi:hypothetical protein
LMDHAWPLLKNQKKKKKSDFLSLSFFFFWGFNEPLDNSPGYPAVGEIVFYPFDHDLPRVWP